MPAPSSISTETKLRPLLASVLGVTADEADSLPLQLLLRMAGRTSRGLVFAIMRQVVAENYHVETWPAEGPKLASMYDTFSPTITDSWPGASAWIGMWLDDLTAAENDLAFDYRSLCRSEVASQRDYEYYRADQIAHLFFMLWYLGSHDLMPVAPLLEQALNHLPEAIARLDGLLDTVREMRASAQVGVESPHSA